MAPTPDQTAEMCRKFHTHDDQEPRHYEAWHLWAQEMVKTHSQHRCPSCHLFKVWRSRTYTAA